MAKNVEKLITIECGNCGNAFIQKVSVKAGTEGTVKSEIDVTCPHCNTLLTVEIEGKIRLDRIALRRFQGQKKL